MIQVFKKLDWFFKQYWKRYTFAIIALIIASVIDIIPPKLVGMAIDAIQYETLTYEHLANLLIIYGVLLVSSYVITFLWDYNLFGGAVMVEKQLRTRLMNSFLKMSPIFFGKFRTGDLMARSTNDLKAISLTTGFGVLTLVDSSVFMFMLIAVMGFTISWKLTLAALLPLPVMALVMQKYGGLLHQRFMKAQTAFGDMNNEVLESIHGVRVLRAYGQEKQDALRFQTMTKDVYAKNVEVAKVDAMFEPTMKVLVGISYTIGLGYGAILVFQNTLTLGQLVSFNVYLGMLIWPMFAVGELINIMQRGNASLDRVGEILSYNPDVTDSRNLRKVQIPEKIEFEKVSFSYPDTQEQSLKKVSFSVSRGETIGLVGKTGSGKTTLLKQLLREYPSFEGSIQLNGTPIEQLGLRQLRSWIGYVPQDQLLFSRTIRENIQFGKSNATDEEIYRAMDMAGFLPDLHSLPQGLDTKVGESGVTLSGGQKQRVALARAFVKDPEILILDDSLSAVDGKTEAVIIEHLKQERQNKTNFIAAHRMSAVKHADQIIVLEDGRIAEKGSHQELMESAGWYSIQYRLQQLGDGEGLL